MRSLITSLQWCSMGLMVIFAGAVFLTNCGGSSEETSSTAIETEAELNAENQLQNIETAENPLTFNEAYAIALKETDLNPHNLLYWDVLPYLVSESEVILTWGFVEKLESNDIVVTYIDRWNGELLTNQALAAENILTFLTESGHTFTDAEQERTNSTATYHDYDSFPENWRLPINETNHAYLLCGYNFDSHTKLNYYATDWNPGNTEHLIESPASCWVLSTIKNDSGASIVCECGDAGNDERYFYQVANLNDAPLVSSSWWIWKNQALGYAGFNAIDSNSLVHFAVFKAKNFSGSTFISGESIPINQWPEDSDSICEHQFEEANFWGEGPRDFGVIQTNGCP